MDPYNHNPVQRPAPPSVPARPEPVDPWKYEPVKRERKRQVATARRAWRECLLHLGMWLSCTKL